MVALHSVAEILVAEFFGECNFEYEWTWTIAPRDVVLLKSVLQSGALDMGTLTNSWVATC
jgi:hypothetical protein